MKKNIDFTEFKKIVRSGKEEKIIMSGYLYKLQRDISLYGSWLTYSYFPKITPNTVSVFNVVLVFVAALLSSMAEYDPYMIFFLQLIILFTTGILDKVDGELARAKGVFTQAGIYYDILYHFLYLFVFYFSLAVFVAAISEISEFIIAGSAVAVLMMLHGMLGKIRHHVRYKIMLENHQDVISNFTVAAKKIVPRWRQRIKFLFFMPYEWTWLLHVFFAGSVYILPVIAAPLYSVYICTLTLVTGYTILWWYPNNRLFQHGDFTAAAMMQKRVENSNDTPAR